MSSDRYTGRGPRGRAPVLPADRLETQTSCPWLGPWEGHGAWVLGAVVLCRRVTGERVVLRA